MSACLQINSREWKLWGSDGLKLFLPRERLENSIFFQTDWSFVPPEVDPATVPADDPKLRLRLIGYVPGMRDWRDLENLFLGYHEPIDGKELSDDTRGPDMWIFQPGATSDPEYGNWETDLKFGELDGFEFDFSLEGLKSSERASKFKLDYALKEFFKQPLPADWELPEWINEGDELSFEGRIQFKEILCSVPINCAQPLEWAMVAARTNLWTMPGLAALVVLICWPDSSPLWLFAGIAAALGAFAGTLPLDREVFPRIKLNDLLRQGGISCLLRFLVWTIFLGITVFMPSEFSPLAWCLGGLGIGLLELWARGGFFWLGWKIGLFQPAPERLVRIVTETASRMQVPVREVLLLRVAVAQAAALPGQGKLLFTERILELLADDELAAVCAHELGHLTESRSDIAKRMIGRLIFLPWLFFNPLIHTYGNVAFFSLCLLTVAVPRVSRHISRRLELRADAMAKTNEGDAGTYARALTRLYEDNLSPAVNAKKMATHPHLYDRLLAAGVTPDFPRPAAPAAMAVTGSVFAGLVGMLFAWFVIRMMNP